MTSYWNQWAPVLRLDLTGYLYMIGWNDRSLQNFRGKTTCTAESAKFLNVWLLNIFSSIQQKIA